MSQVSVEEAFLAAYDAHADAIFRYCYLKTGNRDLAKDLAQDAFSRTWEYIASGKRVDNVRAFVYRTAHNLIINEGKRATASSLDQLREDVSFDPPDGRAPPDQEAELALLRSHLQALDPASRDVLALRYLDDLPVTEIARILDATPNTISVRLRRATERLRALIHPDA